MIPFPPGGGYDAVGRPWAEKVKTLLGTVVVENQGGSGSSLGAAAVARARPDGYTILLGGSSTHITEAILKTRPLYDPIKDLEPISNIVLSAFALAINPALPAHTLKEFIDYAKANPGRLSYGHAGIGSLNHLTGELFKSLTGTADIVQVPYRGSGPATADTISGQVAMVTPAVTASLLELHRSGKLRILAVTSPARLIAAPEIPTALEAGVPGMVSLQSIGLFAPAGTPIEIIEQISRASRAVVADRPYQQFLIKSGFEPDIELDAQQIPATRRTRHCQVDAGHQSDRIEARLIPKRLVVKPELTRSSVWSVVAGLVPIGAKLATAVQPSSPPPLWGSTRGRVGARKVGALRAMAAAEPGG